MVTCFECKGHGHVKKECPTYLKARGKVFATNFSDSNGSNSNLEESYDGEENYSVFMAIAPMDSSEDLNQWELGKNPMMKMKEPRNCKNLIILFLRKPESML